MKTHMKQGYVYFMTNRKNECFYIGVTSDLIDRVYKHKNGTFDGFSKKYNLHKLVYFEAMPLITDAIMREKKFKRWHRQWKINWITQHNPEWKDLYDTIIK